MAFKSINAYNDDRYHGMFILKNDQDFADVVMMYRNRDDVLVGDAHYIKSADYSGYVECAGRGCPACARGIRVQSKLFIPVYVIEQNEILFWDRNLTFDQILDKDVFSNYPNPSDVVFRITRNGAAGDRDTRYVFKAIARNTSMSYEHILQHLGITSMADHLDTICKSWSIEEYNQNLNTQASAETSVDLDSMPEYKLSPRVSTSEASVELPELPELDDLSNVGSLPIDEDAPIEGQEALPLDEVDF